MSNLLFPIASTIGLIFFTIVLVVYFSHQNRRIKRLVSGQEEWRKIALKHSEDSNLNALELSVWGERFRSLVIYLWGNPPLDRTMQDVKDFFSSLVDEVNALRTAKAALTKVVVQLDHQRKDLHKRIEQAEEMKISAHDRACRLENMIAFLLSKKLVLEVSGTDFVVRPAYCKRGKPLRFYGPTPDDAIEKAMLNFDKSPL